MASVVMKCLQHGLGVVGAFAALCDVRDERYGLAFLQFLVVLLTATWKVA